MSSVSTATIARKLIRAFADISSTEEFILYVAGTDNMLSFCQDLIEQYDLDNHAAITLEVNTICAEQGILTNLLYSEIRKVLIALNRFHDTSLDHYATLGLQKDASIDQIKKAYRQLSKSYHPDMVQNENNDTQKFMQISGAYHAIMANLTDSNLPKQKSWRKKSRNLKIDRQHGRKKFIGAIILLIFFLAGASFYAAEKFNRQTIREQIELSSQLAANEGDPILPAIEPVSLPSPPVADTVSPKTLTAVATPVGEELPVIASEEEKSTIPPPSQIHIDETPVQIVASLDEPEPPAPKDQAAVAATLSTNTPEIKNPKQQIAKASEIEKVSKELTVEQKHPSTQKQPAQKDHKQAIDEILAEYIKLYNARDLEHLLALFSDNATENGQLQTEVIDQYKSFFTHIQTLTLDLEKINWQEFKDGFQGKGTFKSNYTYKDGRTKNHTGDITFYLAYNQDKLKIQSLDYVFSD